MFQMEWRTKYVQTMSILDWGTFILSRIISRIFWQESQQIWLILTNFSQNFSLKFFLKLQMRTKVNGIFEQENALDFIPG